MRNNKLERRNIIRGPSEETGLVDPETLERAVYVEELWHQVMGYRSSDVHDEGTMEWYHEYLTLLREDLEEMTRGESTKGVKETRTGKLTEADRLRNVIRGLENVVYSVQLIKIAKNTHLLTPARKD